MPHVVHGAICPTVGNASDTMQSLWVLATKLYCPERNAVYGFESRLLQINRKIKCPLLKLNQAWVEVALAKVAENLLKS